jgi:hypothetical protein
MRTQLSISASQQRAARVAGLTFLLAITIIVITNYSVSFRLIVSGNAAETATNILANETLFRLNVVGDLLYLFNLVIMLSALHVVLKPIAEGLSLIAAFARFVYASVWAMIGLNILDAVRFLGDAAYLPAFTADQLQAMAMLHLERGNDLYYIGLPFWGLAAVLISYLFLKSRYIPKLLAWFGLLASAWCVICGVAFLIDPGFGDAVHPGWFDMPLVVFEIILGFWLLIKGLGSSKGTREEF